MSVTADLNMINLQVVAQAAQTAAIADGSYKARRAADPKAFLWQSQYQTIPEGTETDPRGYARALRTALPLVNSLRIPFNFWSFNADGSLDPRFEAFLDEATRQGFRLLFVYMDGEGQRYGTSRVPGTETETAPQIAAALRGEVLTRAKTSFDRLQDWLDRHPHVRDKTWGLELMNEPAAFKTGMNRLPKTDAEGRAGFVALYATVMVDLARHVERRWPGRILVGGFAYSADFTRLARTRMPDGGITALDYIRQGVGPRLVWSAHLYPNWIGGPRTRAGMDRALQGKYGPLGDDDILLTETNAPEQRTYKLRDRADPNALFSRNFEWFADHGIGIAWFPGAQSGNSSFVTYTPGKPLLFGHLASYGAGMNAFTLGGPSTGQAETLAARLIPGMVRLDRTAPAALLRHDPTGGAQGIALAAGHAGDDTITGASGAVNFLYGGKGGDRITGAGPADYLYGQDGNDTITDPGTNSGGDDHLFGGRGNDLIVTLGTGYSSLWGGPGGDRFSLAPTSRAVIADYAPEEGDTADFRGRYASLAEVVRHLSILDYDGNGTPDLMIWHGTGYAIFLDMGDRVPEFLRSLAEFPAPTILPPLPRDPVAGTPFSPETGIDPDGPPVPPEPVPPATRFAPGPGTAIHAQNGSPFTAGTEGDDTIRGRGDDILLGGPGNDLIREARGRATIFGGEGNDTIQSGRRPSQIVTGAGDDRVELDMRNAGHAIWLGPGRDTVAITALGHATRPGRFARAQVFGFDPARDRIEVLGQPVDLSQLPANMTLSRFARGQVLAVNDFARLFLYAPGAPDPAALTRAAEFDPHFDPAHPARHMR